jgi:hypothetical protein
MSSPSASKTRAEATREAALHVLKRRGYTVADLDYLLFAGPGTGRADDDPELQQAVTLLARLRGREWGADPFI